MSKNIISIQEIVIRSFFYGLTTAFVLTSGFIIVNKGLSSNAILLIPVFFFSIDFFMKYSICFHYSQNESVVSKDQLHLFQKEISWIYFILSCLVLVLCIFGHRIITGEWKFNNLLSLFLFVALMYLYGRFILRKHRNGERLTIRHQIVWPTILTIAFGLYYAIYFEKFSSEVYPYYPVIIVIIYFIISEKLIKNPKRFFLLSLTFSFIGLMLVFLFSFEVIFIEPEYNDIMSTILFSIVFSAYLGVFESWRVTAYVKEIGHNVNYNTELLKEPNSPYPEWNKYFICTLGALIISICIIPFVFVFSKFGTIFLIGFSLHAFIAFSIWITFGYDYTNNKKVSRTKFDYQNVWIFLKIIMGFSCLSLLVWDSTTAQDRIPPVFHSETLVKLIFFLITTIYIFLLRSNYIKNKNSFNGEVKWWVFLHDRINCLLITGLLACIFFICIDIMRDATSDLFIKNKIDYALLLYSIITILILLVIPIHFVYSSYQKGKVST